MEVGNMKNNFDVILLMKSHEKSLSKIFRIGFSNSGPQNSPETISGFGLFVLKKSFQGKALH